MDNLIKLNPALDLSALKKTFAKDRRLHIPRILTGDSAERIYRCLTTDVDWHLVFNEGDKTHTLYPEQIKAMTEDHKQKIRQIVLTKARKGFQYFYKNYNIYDYYLNGKNMEHFLHRFHEFANSKPFLSFAKEITGIDTIAFADSQATAYEPGHFLTENNGFNANKEKKVAYVFNLSPKWKTEWGGLLQFLDEKTGQVEIYVPTFNTLSIFAVPARYNISFVTPFAQAIRYSITGWLKEGE